jgi:aspartate/methionine/tyrosine aminotransferase
MSYAIREVVEHARILERQGHEIIRLNIGDPVMFGFQTPEHVKKAFVRAIEEGESGYSDSEGIPELREAVARREKAEGVDISAEDVIATTGVTEGLEMVLAAALDESSEILIPGPTYPAYQEYAKLFGAKPVAYRKIEAEGWRPDIGDIRGKITSRTKAIIICSPNNPTGAVYPTTDLQEMMDIAGEEGIFVIADEIYDKITYGGAAGNPASINKDVPTVVLNGLSKVYTSPGWRVGYIAFRDPSGVLSDIREGVLKQARARLCANTVGQYGLLAALEGPQDHVKQMCERLRPRRDLAAKMINGMEGLSVTLPMGAFYMFPRIDGSLASDDMQFVLDVLQNCHVLLVHGSGFNAEYGKDHFRLVFLAPEEMLGEALSRIERYVAKIGA